ncbi:MAG TPA: chemoreceptor glutamine deamidase CheD [Chromatiales bacterium]|nr:chemoreceptor glutamine deamidase CheD [Chromatiales bacterium]
MLTQRSQDTPICNAPPVALPGFGHIKRYWDKQTQLYTAKILPGQFYVTRNHEAITTVLGSCISACIRDPVKGIGGMNHFMLPDEGGKSFDDISLSDAARYGNYAMEMLINEILKNGGERRNLEAKVFGGGKIIKNMTNIGERNIQFAMHYLSMENIEVIASDVGSHHPRKVQYIPATGKARVMKLRSLHNDTIIKRETSFMKDISQKPVQGEVDLF